MEVKKGDLFFADLNPVVGSEQGGIRPIVIIQNDKGNKYSPTTVVATITSRQTKKPLPTHVEIKVGNGITKKSIVMLEQIRTIDKTRLLEHIGTLEQEDVKRIDEALVISLSINKEEKKWQKEHIYQC